MQTSFNLATEKKMIKKNDTIEPNKSVHCLNNFTNLTLEYIFTKYILLSVLCVCVEEGGRGGIKANQEGIKIDAKECRKC